MENIITIIVKRCIIIFKNNIINIANIANIANVANITNVANVANGAPGWRKEVYISRSVDPAEMTPGWPQASP